jgi:hypothetical protein
VLEAAGFQVVVTSGRHVKNLPGRKTDMSDWQWMAPLHAHGLAAQEPHLLQKLASKPGFTVHPVVTVHG